MEYARSIRLSAESTPNVAYCPALNWNGPPGSTRINHKSSEKSLRSTIRAVKCLSIVRTIFLFLHCQFSLSLIPRKRVEPLSARPAQQTQSDGVACLPGGSSPSIWNRIFILRSRSGGIVHQVTFKDWYSTATEYTAVH